MDTGINYPTALNKAIGINLNEPNDLLGVSYIKAILKNNYNIEPITIKRTNSYHDTTSNDLIVSASNIRDKIDKGIDINKYVPEYKINTINYELFFNLLKYKIISETDLNNLIEIMTE